MLKNCQNLEELSIEGQKNITGKLENLPSSVETFNCKGTFFQKELEEFGHNRNLKILRLARENERLEVRIAEEGEIHREAAFSLSRAELAVKSQKIEELESQAKKLQHQNKQHLSRIQELENEPKITEQLMEKSEQEIKILHEQLETKQLADKIKTKRQQLNNLKQKLLSDNSQTTESELNNLCQLHKELIYLEQHQNQIIKTKILQIELPKF
jgi:chromosome segregation ATPase